MGGERERAKRARARRRVGETGGCRKTPPQPVLALLKASSVRLYTVSQQHVTVEHKSHVVQDESLAFRHRPVAVRATVQPLDLKGTEGR